MINYCKTHHVCKPIAKCQMNGCYHQSIGIEVYKAKVSYGITIPQFSQYVPFCDKHRCQYVFCMSNPQGVKCNQSEFCKH